MHKAVGLRRPRLGCVCLRREGGAVSLYCLVTGSCVLRETIAQRVVRGSLRAAGSARLSIYLSSKVVLSVFYPRAVVEDCHFLR